MSVKKKPPVEWKGDFDKSTTAVYGDYILRAEDVGPNVWWAVFYEKYEIFSGYTITMRGAMLKALYAMKRDIKHNHHERTIPYQTTA